MGGRREIGKRGKIGECVKCEEWKIGSEFIAGTILVALINTY